MELRGAVKVGTGGKRGREQAAMDEGGDALIHQN